MTEEKESSIVPTDQVSYEWQLKFQELKLRAAFNKGLAKFRQQVKAPKKNGHVDFTSKNGRTKYDYILLDDLIQSIDEGSKDTGLSWRQEVETDGQMVKVRTIISHENGYEYQSPWLALSSNNRPQDVGSAITYAKRYSLGTTFGINSETDDDGQEAQRSSVSHPTTSKAPRPKQPSLLASKAEKNALATEMQGVANEVGQGSRDVYLTIMKQAGINHKWEELTTPDIKSLNQKLTTYLSDFKKNHSKTKQESNPFEEAGV